MDFDEGQDLISLVQASFRRLDHIDDGVLSDQDRHIIGETSEAESQDFLEIDLRGALEKRWKRDQLTIYSSNGLDANDFIF